MLESKNTQLIENKDYDINNPADREIIRQFERELNGRDFEQYCYDTGLMIKNDRYKYGAIVYSHLAQYEEFRKKKRGLEALRFSREMAKKHELEALSATADAVGEQ